MPQLQTRSQSKLDSAHSFMTTGTSSPSRHLAHTQMPISISSSPFSQPTGTSPLTESSVIPPLTD